MHQQWSSQTSRLRPISAPPWLRPSSAAPSLSHHQVGLYSRPLQQRSRLGAALVVAYLVLFSVALLWTAVRFALELGPLEEMRRFVNGKLGVSERDMRTVTWPARSRSPRPMSEPEADKGIEWLLVERRGGSTV